jgi:hypothetical protein
MAEVVAEDIFSLASDYSIFGSDLFLGLIEK